ncbi:MAG: DUF3189 family protein [Syntrophomonadaceae bacterium]|nr:DUF3189 family protein [Syntrophomonadaceae bacterium]
MWIFYCCPTGGFESVVAASIHTGILSLNRLPLEDELLSLPEFGVRHQLSGRPKKYGIDTLGNEVFILGIGREKGLVSNIVPSFFEANKLCPAQAKVVEINVPKVNIVTDYLFLNLRFDNRWKTKIIINNYFHIAQIVKEVLDQVN